MWVSCVVIWRVWRCGQSSIGVTKTNFGLRAISIDIIFINIHLHKYPLGFSNDIPRNGPRPPENTTGEDHLTYLGITPQPAIFLELTVINIITINIPNIIILVNIITVTLRRSWYLVSLCMGLSRYELRGSWCPASVWQWCKIEAGLFSPPKSVIEG